jgi:hypothetical protein
MKKTLLIIFSFLILYTGVGMPAENTGERQDKNQREFATPPSQEAIDACHGLKHGDACELSTPSGMEAGICQVIQAELACIPTVKLQSKKGLQ